MARINGRKPRERNRDGAQGAHTVKPVRQRDGIKKSGGPGCLNRIPASISGASAGLGCQAEWQRVEVGLIGCAAVKARMRSPAVVKLQIPADRTARLADGVVSPQIHLLVFDAAPQPFDKDVVRHRLDIDQNALEYPFSSIKKGEICRFPYAILEIKVKDTKATRNNAWLADLISSHLVKEAPQFSKFVHGVAQLFEDSVNSFPFWLNDLESDIRRDPETAFQEEQQKQAKKAEDEFAVGSFLPGSKPSPSPAFKAKVGSPHKFPDDKKNGQRSEASRSQLNNTAEERDSDEDGVHGNGAKVQGEVTDSSPGGLRSFLPAFSNSRYAQRHRQRNAWEDAALPPGVKDPGKWIKDSGPVKVEAKVWLANQRTFIKWQHIAVLLASLSLGLYNAAGVDNDIARALALVYTAFAVFAGAWGWGVYMWRSKLITERSGKDFDNMTGPFIVSIGLAAALCLNFGFKYSAALVEREGPSKTGPGSDAFNTSTWADLI